MANTYAIIGTFLVIFSLLVLLGMTIWYFYYYSGAQVTVSGWFWGFYIFFGAFLLIGFGVGLYGSLRREKLVEVKQNKVKAVIVN